MSLQAVILGRVQPGASLALPLYACRVPAGFPSPADDHLDGRLDLNERLITHPSATFFAYAEGCSMLNAGIHDGDLLIVNRALRPRHGSIVIASVDGELTVKRYCLRGGRAHLNADNPEYPNIELHEGQDVTIWGVVTHNVHELGSGALSGPSLPVRELRAEVRRGTRRGEARPGEAGR